MEFPPSQSSNQRIFRNCPIATRQIAPMVRKPKRYIWPIWKSWGPEQEMVLTEFTTGRFDFAEVLARLCHIRRHEPIPLHSKPIEIRWRHIPFMLVSISGLELQCQAQENIRFGLFASKSGIRWSGCDHGGQEAGKVLILGSKKESCIYW